MIFLAQYNFSDTDSPFALRRLHTAELCSPRSEVPWNIAVVNRLWSGSWGMRWAFPLYSPSFFRQRTMCLETQSVLSYSVRTPCRPSFSPVLHSPSSQTRTPEAFLRGGGHHFFQAFSTPQVRYVFLSMTSSIAFHS